MRYIPQTAPVNAREEKGGKFPPPRKEIDRQTPPKTSGKRRKNDPCRIRNAAELEATVGAIYILVKFSKHTRNKKNCRKNKKQSGDQVLRDVSEFCEKTEGGARRTLPRITPKRTRLRANRRTTSRPHWGSPLRQYPNNFGNHLRLSCYAERDPCKSSKHQRA